MSESTGRRGRHRLGSTTTGSIRKSRFTRIVSVASVAGVLVGGLTLAAAPANAATLPPASSTPQNLPNCILPAGGTWQYDGAVMAYNPRLRREAIAYQKWSDVINGVDYFGTVYSGPTVIAPDKAFTSYFAACSYFIPD